MTEKESWSTAELVRLTGVSSRTLRHYDHVGLLVPAGAAPGGQRRYERPQLRRLQHVLLLRQLGLGLADIAAVLDGSDDEVEALRRHHDRLLADADRLLRLADTVAKSIEEREGGDRMSADEMFAAFRNDPYAAEARERWPEQYAATRERTADWGPEQVAAMHAEKDTVHRTLARLMTAGEPVDAPAVQSAVAAHHAWVGRFWTPGREAYIGLGRMYVDDPRFTATIDAYAAGLSPYLAEAMAVYAGAHLE
ncbi:DNA-binding transcriptional MerR regulator [Pseudonocardia sediminis]|uniref:DNA-binding transcriptional MerR regulator n=1 Tax=Pseudonocardia sediminis TaxID=1397368 RepID=A0A4Q7UVZ9_PSEST|nr:MerR family transcriptional regulator [Pseudonocardia sediminis]RZT86102.1 DNA-binding transcriptional MerR regulator [Pseudonocardia sediminis]